jgi:hypothetical protein
MLFRLIQELFLLRNHQHLLRHHHSILLRRLQQQQGIQLKLLIVQLLFDLIQLEMYNPLV